MIRHRLRWPGSERARLTTLYGGLLILAGGLLTSLVYTLVRGGLYASIGTAVVTSARNGSSATKGPPVPPQSAFRLSGSTGESPRFLLATKPIVSAAENAALSRLLTVSLLSLAIFALLSIALAWWMAGRVLRPVAVLTATARRLSGENLHERIDLKGPPGELKQLADTFDDMLSRIEHLVGAQRRFVANAAHELRTPLSVQRAAAEIGLADPDLDPQRIARIRRKLIDVADHSEQLLDGLLLLSVSDEGLQTVEPVTLDEMADQVAADLADEARRCRVTVETALQPLTVDGEAVLLNHLVHNLVGNAIRYNHPGGRVMIRVDADGLEVSNTGPSVPPEVAPQLFEPFRRMQERRHTPGEGAGLGLSIVASIARAHGAEASAVANPDGGLTVHIGRWVDPQLKPAQWP